MSNVKKPEQLHKEVKEVLGEIEVLMKSWSMSKADEESDSLGDDQMAPEGAASEGDDQMAPEGDESMGDDQMAPEGAAPEGDDQMAPEGDEQAPQEGDDSAEMEQHLAELSDEELQMMYEAIHNELEKRQSAPQDDQAAPAAPAAPGQLEMSMKQEFAKLNKSFQSQTTELRKSIDGLKKENQDLKKKMNMPTNRPVSTNAKASEKGSSSQQAQPLNKSETLDYLLGQMRSGNKSVNSDMVAFTNASRDEYELSEAHARISAAGITMPSRKK